MLYICNVHPFWQLLPILPNRVWAPITTWTPLSGFRNFSKDINCILLVELILLLITRNKNNCCKKPKLKSVISVVGWAHLPFIKALAHYARNCKKCSSLPYTLKVFFTTATIFTKTFFIWAAIFSPTLL